MRQPKPFFRKQTSSWYVQIKGKQHPLGKDKDEAFRLYHELMANPNRYHNRWSDSWMDLVAVLIDRFLAYSEKNNSKRTYEWYVRHL